MKTLERHKLTNQKPRNLENSQLDQLYLDNDSVSSQVKGGRTPDKYNSIKFNRVLTVLLNSCPVRPPKNNI